MNCDSTRRELLDLGWNEAARDRVAGVLHHLGECEECQEAIRDYDHVRSAIRLPEEVEPAGGWDSFEGRLTRACAAAPARRWGWLPVLSLAASIVLALAGGWMYWQAVRQRPAPQTLVTETKAGAANFLTLNPQELADRVRAFREVSEVFDQRTNWMLVSEQASDLGLSSQPAGKGDRLLLIRLVLSRDKDVLSSADLMILAGRSASVAIPSKSGLALNYQIATSASDPKDLQIWAELKRPGNGDQALSVLATNLEAAPGKLTPVGQMMTSSGRYDVSVELCPADLQARS